VRDEAGAVQVAEARRAGRLRAALAIGGAGDGAALSVYGSRGGLRARTFVRDVATTQPAKTAYQRWREEYVTAD